MRPEAGAYLEDVEADVAVLVNVGVEARREEGDLRRLVRVAGREFERQLERQSFINLRPLRCDAIPSARMARSDQNRSLRNLALAVTAHSPSEGLFESFARAVAVVNGGQIIGVE